jgi:uncharacterized protein (TIGR02996 family)
MTIDHLKQARSRLAADDDEGALGALLEAWRASRAPRVADLVDLLSARVARRREPIRGKTVKARFAQWKAISAGHDPADVERLLAMLWPPRWQAALELLGPLGEWPDDPRIARGLLGSLGEDRYNTWTSYQFYRPLLRQMQRICDPRTLAPMKKWVAQDHPHYVEHTKPLVREAIAAVEKSLPGYRALDAGGEAICAELEQLLGAGAQARTEEQEAALLAAVYESPGDPACRQVYADFLSERGDPRGELIALQLAPERDARSRRREGALLKAHRREWLGPLARRVVEKSAVFRGGFPAEVELKPLSGKLHGDLSHPAWSTVKVVKLERSYWSGDLPNEFFELPWVKALDGIYNLHADYLPQVAGAPLTHLGISGSIGGDEARATLEKKKAFPKLRVLGVDEVTPEQIEQLSKMPLLKRIERLLLAPDDRDHLKALIGKLDRLPRSIREVWLLRRYPGDMRDPTGWRNVFRRDDRGKLGRMTLCWGGGSFETWHMELGQVPRKAVSSVALELPRREWSQKEIKTIEGACSHLRELGIALPWSDAPEPPAALEPRGPPVSLSLFGDEAIDRKNLEWIWSWLQDKRSPLGYLYDSFRVNSGVHRTLGADPLARITKWVKPATRWLELYCDGQEELRRLLLGGYRCLGLDTDGFSEEGFAARYLDWLMPLLDRLPLERGEVAFTVEQQLNDTEREETPSPLSGLHEAPGLQEWVSIFGAGTRTLITPGDLDRAAEASGGMVRVRHGERVSVAVLGGSPLSSQREALQSDGVIAFQNEVQRRFRKNFAMRVGYDFIERVGKSIAPAAAAIGLEPWPELEGALPTLRFGASRRERRFWIHLQLSRLLDEPTLGAGMHDGKDWSWRPFELEGRDSYGDPAPDRQTLDATLQAIADQLPTTAASYMEQCLSGTNEQS